VSVDSSQLSETEWSVINFIEQMYYIDGAVASTDRIATALSVDKTTVEKILKRDFVRENIQGRGISLAVEKDLLTTKQLTGLAVFFDTKDGRSLRKKLSDAEISTGEWEAWKSDPVFSAHMRARAEAALVKNLAETEVALLDSAHRGDISAIKLHLEMTGRWSSKTVGELNVEFLLMKILEAVQKHVKDPVAIEAIANELLALVPNQSAPSAPAIMPGAASPLPL
jgi:hypothetical protein